MRSPVGHFSKFKGPLTGIQKIRQGIDRTNDRLFVSNFTSNKKYLHKRCSKTNYATSGVSNDLREKFKSRLMEKHRANQTKKTPLLISGKSLMRNSIPALPRNKNTIRGIHRGEDAGSLMVFSPELYKRKTIIKPNHVHMIGSKVMGVRGNRLPSVK